MSASTQSTPESPKSKKSFWTIVFIIAVLVGIDRYTFHYVSGGETTSDSISVSKVDTVKAPVAAVDTAKKDTTKKK